MGACLGQTAPRRLLGYVDDTLCVAASPQGVLWLRQVWQWIKHGATLQPGNKPLTKEGFEAALKEELAALRKQVRCSSTQSMQAQYNLCFVKLTGCCGGRRCTSLRSMEGANIAALFEITASEPGLPGFS